MAATTVTAMPPPSTTTTVTAMPPPSTTTTVTAMPPPSTTTTTQTTTPHARCPKCEGIEIEHEGANAYCVECGYVIDESNIVVDELTFSEDSSGLSSVVGQFVSSTGSVHRRTFRVGGYSRSSREVTVEAGRRRCSQIAALLQLRPHQVEAAQRLFMIAVQRNFIHGRKTQNVVAACLYIVCRREKTPHMLIDFADVLQTDVHSLGHTFLRFCRLLLIQLPLVDPSLYLERFAAKLEFEEKTNQVANTALRIVQRMGRDWIQTGRRPSGICGAGLCIASRIHGFRRTLAEIVRVVHIGEVTLRKRLNEFSHTPSSKLSLHDLLNGDPVEECDPPVFVSGLKQQEKKRIKAEISHEQDKRKFGEVMVKIEKAMEEENGGSKDDEKDFAKFLSERWKRRKLADDALGKENSDHSTSPVNMGANDELNPVKIRREMEKLLASEEIHVIEKFVAQNGGKPLNAPFLLPNAPQMMKNFAKKIGEAQASSATGETGDEEVLSDIDDSEVENYIYSNEEMKVKEVLWNSLNRDYIQEMEEKEKNQSTSAPEEDSKRRRKRVRKSAEVVAESPAEAAREALQKRVTSKVNWKALDQLFAVDSNQLFAGTQSDRSVTLPSNLENQQVKQPELPVNPEEVENYIDDSDIRDRQKLVGLKEVAELERIIIAGESDENPVAEPVHSLQQQLGYVEVDDDDDDDDDDFF